MDQPEINRLNPTYSFSKKDIHIQRALLKSVFTAKAISFFNPVGFAISNQKSAT